MNLGQMGVPLSEFRIVVRGVIRITVKAIVRCTPQDIPFYKSSYDTAGGAGGQGMLGPPPGPEGGCRQRRAGAGGRGALWPTGRSLPLPKDARYGHRDHTKMETYSYPV